MENFNLNFNFNIANQKAGLVGQNQMGQNQVGQNQGALNNINPNNPNSVNNLLNQTLGQIQGQVQGQVQGQLGQNLPMFNNGTEPAVIYQPISFEYMTMEQETLLRYLQNLLKLPESIDKFINQLKTDPKNAEILAKIIQQNLVDVKGLNEFLNKNSTEAIQKLYMTIMSVLKTGSNEISQLKELMSVLNFLQTSTNLNPNSIKEFLLLYLPLDILQFNQMQSMGVEAKNGLSEDKDYDISIMIQTLNFSNILCAIKEEENNLFIKLSANTDFPYEKFAKMVAYMALQLTLNVELEHNEIIKSENDKKHDKQSFNVASKGSIPVNALILAQFIIKTVFKIDKDFT